MPSQPLPLDPLQQTSGLSARDLWEALPAAVGLVAAVAGLVSWWMAAGAA